MVKKKTKIVFYPLGNILNRARPNMDSMENNLCLIQLPQQWRIFFNETLPATENYLDMVDQPNYRKRRDTSEYPSTKLQCE